MAQPTQPIEIWAQSDVVLPVSHQINKVRPIDDLWEKGYDKGQKPANEEWNYLWNMTTLWLSYITGEQIPELDNRYLQRSLNLSDVADKAASRTNLEVYSKTESESRYVNVEGDTMTGPLGVTRLNFTQVASSDNASIFAQTTASDKTFLDFNIGDNAGDAQAAGNVVDVMRFRFQPTTGAAVSMMELNSLDGTNAYLRVLGQIWGRQLTVAGNLSWTGSGTGNTLSLTGSLAAASLNISSQSAIVGGRNVVRSVNGVTADGNGNVSLQTGAVQDVRLGAQNTFTRNVSAVESFVYRPPSGCVVTAFDIQSARNNQDEFTAIYSRPIQKLINGSWVTVAQV